MIDTLRTWFNGRTVRERWMLLAMAAMIVLTVIWFAIFLPISDGLSSSRARLDVAVVRLADAEAEAGTLTELQRNRPAPIPGALDDYIRQSAGNAGFALSDVGALGNGRIHIAVPTARPGALFTWLADLEGAGVIVASIQVTNNGDQTVAAQMTLMKRGA
jgi:general secretion pathway protein M